MFRVDASRASLVGHRTKRPLHLVAGGSPVLMGNPILWLTAALFPSLHSGYSRFMRSFLWRRTLSLRRSSLGFLDAGPFGLESNPQ